jgi:hypothetical protein
MCSIVAAQVQVKGHTTGMAAEETLPPTVEQMGHAKLLTSDGTKAATKQAFAV